MKRVRVINLKPEDAEGRIEALEPGYQVEYDGVWTRPIYMAIRQNPPDAFVIDLDRIPSHGKYIALALRESKSTRRVPIVFCGGAPDKVEQLKALLPDATYTVWTRIRSAVRSAIANPPAAPVVPKSNLGYSGTPLVKKLGIKEGSRVVLIAAPEEFEETLGELPDQAVISKSLKAGTDLAIWFVRSRFELERNISLIPARLGSAPVWIAWPKRSSGVTTDVAEPLVRQIALAEGLVDYKICAIDATWSALLFSTKKAKAAKN